MPEKYDGEILVPFSPESYLSGVHRQLQPKEFLWYQRTFHLQEIPDKQRLILHFGACDERCRVYINEMCIRDSDSCLEGLASGPSIEARWGKKAYELADNQVVWELESEYLAKAMTNIILTLSPQKIILGGGVMHQEQLFPMIRAKVLEYLNHYYETPYLENMDEYIVPALSLIHILHRRICD